MGADDAAHDLGDQDLVADRLRFNALSRVYRRSKQILPFHDGLAGVDPYPYMDLPVRMAAVLLSQCPLDTDRALHGPPRRVERHHEIVAGGLDHSPAVRLDLLTHHV